MMPSQDSELATYELQVWCPTNSASARCYNCSTVCTEHVNIVQSTEQLCVVHVVSNETDVAAVNGSNHVCYVYLYSDW